MGFELYEDSGNKTSSRLYVSIQQSGNFRLNRIAYEKLGKPEAVQIFWDDERKLVGLKPASLNDDSAVRVRSYDMPGHMISALAFLNQHDIDRRVGRKVDAELRDGMLVFDVTQYINEGWRNG